MDCGQSDAISKLMQHVTEDQRFQENIGDPRASVVGLNQYNLMSPQSFRMDDLVREMGIIEPQTTLMPSPSSSHFDVQSHSSLDTFWSTEHQNQMQETFQPKIQQEMWNIPNVPCYNPAEGFIKVLHVNGLPESQNCLDNFIENHVSTWRKSGESRNTVKGLEGTITIENLSELENFEKLENQPDEICTNPQKEVQDEQLPNQNNKHERTTIPEYSNAREFTSIVKTHINECRKTDWKLFPDQKMNESSTSESVLNPMEYSHIENNPMIEVLNPIKNGYEALKNAWFFEAALCFDEAVRRTKTNPENWFQLSYALFMIDKFDEAISAIKHYLLLKPNCFNGASTEYAIYRSSNCKYQACQSIFNWFKNNKSYKHLIPSDFSMDDKETTELDDKLLTSVKNIFMKAARENPTKNIDANLQLMIANLYYISNDYDKVADCTLTAINCAPDNYSGALLKLGYLQFYDEKPNEALEFFFKAASEPSCGALEYQDIGFVYMYMKNYREAIRYFKKSLGPAGLGDETKFQLKGNTLEDEYDLCLRLYCTISNK